MKAHLIATVKNYFIVTLKYDYLGYGNITSLESITHLFDTYGMISESELKLNKDNMTSSWTPPAPVEETFQKFHSGSSFAKASKETITKQKQVRIGYNLMHKTSRLGSVCQRWCKKSSADKMWVNLKTHFKLANQNQRLKATAKDAGCASAANDAHID